MLQNFTEIINWAVLHKDALLQLVGGAAGLSAVSQIVLHKLKVKWDIDSKVFSYTLVQVLTLAATISAYLVDNANIGLVYPWLAVAAATVHRYLVSPYYTKKILPYLTFLSENAQATASPSPAPLAAPLATPAVDGPSFVS